MLDKIKTRFSISDLENLTGISHHSIRIWERRFNLLSPGRSETNIRWYSNSDLKKLLTISHLIKHGYKISDLSILNELQLALKINEISGRTDSLQPEINSFKLAMLNFDSSLFQKVYSKLLSKFSFEEIFQKVFIPLLHDIGALWQTSIITPAQEHFISNLIRQKMFLNIDNQASKKKSPGNSYILFLPRNEIHELGLLYIHYKLLKKGFNSVYIGQSIETNDLKDIRKSVKGKLTYVTYMTVSPSVTEAEEFLNQLTSLLDKGDKVLITGAKSAEVKKANTHKKIFIFENLNDLINTVSK